MRRVTLGYAWEGHKPDTTLELPDTIARRLLHDGKARRADDEVAAELEAAERAVDVVEPEPRGPEAFLRDMKTAELHKFAAERDIVIPDNVATRRELIAAIAAGVTPTAEEAKALEDMTIRELQAYAAAHEIVVPSDVRKRPDLVEFIAAAEQETRVPTPEDPPPADGDTHEEA